MIDQLRLRELEDLKSVLKTVEGRRFVWKLMGNVFTASFNQDPGVMAFKEGERNSGLRIMSDIMEACPDKFVQMQRESKKQQEIDDHERRSAAE